MDHFLTKDAQKIRDEHAGSNPCAGHSRASRPSRRCRGIPFTAIGLLPTRRYCMAELSSMLIGMSVVSQFVGKLVEVVVPRLQSVCRKNAIREQAKADNKAKELAAALQMAKQTGGIAASGAEEAAVPAKLSFYERQILRAPYDVQDDIFKEYNRTLIQLGHAPPRPRPPSPTQGPAYLIPRRPTPASKIASNIATSHSAAATSARAAICAAVLRARPSLSLSLRVCVCVRI